MKKETRERLLKQAKNYESNELNLFIDETGWEEWTNDYLENYKKRHVCDLEEDEIPEEVVKEIDYELKEIFDEAMQEKEKEREAEIENFKEIRIVKEGILWSIYVGDLHCGCYGLEDALETISELENHDDVVKFAKESQECR